MRITKLAWLRKKLLSLHDDPKLPWDSYPCIKWPFSLKGKGYDEGSGYGQVYSDGKPQSCHRMAWIIVYGDIPDGLHVLHHCDVRRCIRPVHLFIGTCADNLKDASLKGRMHPGESNPAAKLTEEQVREARRRLALGESQRSIARSFGIHYNAIWKIAHGLKWKLTV